MKRLLFIGLGISFIIACSNPAPKETAVQEELNSVQEENEGVKLDDVENNTIDTIKNSDEVTAEKPEPVAPVEKEEEIKTVERAPEVKSDYLKTGNKGIGPIRSFEEKPLDQALANRGNQIFLTSCAICHDMDQEKLGPALAKVTKRRTPEWILNMILNPMEMIEKDPDAIALKDSYAAMMLDMGLKEDEARAVLEYLRKEDTK
jgi:mono/diheme cytochrome c family protein